MSKMAKTESIDELKAKIERQNKTIKDLETVVENMKSERCDSEGCAHAKQLEHLEREMEFNIVDSKIKEVNLVDKVNDLEYRNDRLESILLSTPGRFARMVEDLDRSQHRSREEVEKMRRSVVLMRSLSQKLTGKVSKNTPETVIFDRRNRSNVLFEALVMKLEEFRKVFEDCQMETIGVNFFVVCCSITALLNSVNKVVNESVYLKQRVCFQRSSNTNQLVNLMVCEEDYLMLESLKRLTQKSETGEDVDEVEFEGRPLVHPFDFVAVSKVAVEKRSEKDSLRAIFTDDKAVGNTFGRIILRWNVPSGLVLLPNRCVEIFKLFNQIWRYKNVSINQSPVEFSVIGSMAIDVNFVIEEYIDDIIPLSKLNSTHLSDMAREAITFSLAGTIVTCLVLGIRLIPSKIFINKRGKVFLFGLDSLMGMKVNSTKTQNQFILGNIKTFRISDPSILIPEEFLKFFGTSGRIELMASCISAFLNIRKFSVTTSRFVQMVMDGILDNHTVSNYMKRSLMTDIKIDKAIECFKVKLGLNS